MEYHEEIVQRILDNKKIFSKDHVVVKYRCLDKETYSIAKNLDDQLVDIKRGFKTEEEARSYALENGIEIDDILSEKTIIV